MEKRRTGPAPESPESRFLRLVEPMMDDCGCWEWFGHRNGKGYGRFRPAPNERVGWRQQRLVRSHRFAWELYRGPVPAGLHVLHRCDNPSCVNPAHLFLGTNRDNVQDSIRKGRPRGWLARRVSRC